MYYDIITKEIFDSYIENDSDFILEGISTDTFGKTTFRRFVRVPLAMGEHYIEALYEHNFGSFPLSMGTDHFSFKKNLEFMAFIIDRKEICCKSFPFVQLFEDYKKADSNWVTDEMVKRFISHIEKTYTPSAGIKKASLKCSGLQFWITLAVTEELTEEYVKKYSNPDTPEGKFKSLTDSIKNYKNVHLGLDVNGEIDSVKYPVDRIFNMDAMYDGYLDTWSIAPRSEEERIEEFLEENDALLKNQDKIPFKYISDIHYGKKTVWKNPDFES